MVIPVQTPAGLEPAFDLSAYYPILLYAVVVLLFAAGTLAASHLFPLKPRKPTGIKRMPYESGMDPVGTARLQFDVKYAMVAIMFVIFDVELLFLYPWAVVAFGEESSASWRAAFGSTALAAVAVFLAVLALAYYYEWRKGAFTWR
ncbi:MAG: NADH-quinone oxidoreductase subunit A [Thermogemmata sp.]|uniref:NADH-quinone oxidoreductase subunit A n=1 Tax=Thermogemmata fonticola TaxID=2755323 RepID=UPI0021DBF6DF|nr:NADH-quinone oxidoreductase subunit A [Thermogemmata fonticola]MCX8139321.1 NADH-quinone oxidoreductase subunit A [Gemmataceae bacterium]GIW84886.1 MAG: NADH-quinone oxidoreductase subunit A [Gemmataceae bacterium]